MGTKSQKVKLGQNPKTIQAEPTEPTHPKVITGIWHRQTKYIDRLDSTGAILLAANVINKKLHILLGFCPNVGTKVRGWDNIPKGN
jgi:hypothetical protein